LENVLHSAIVPGSPFSKTDIGPSIGEPLFIKIPSSLKPGNPSGLLAFPSIFNQLFIVAIKQIRSYIDPLFGKKRKCKKEKIEPLHGEKRIEEEWILEKPVGFY
jgi:hypothetical protein